MASVFETGMVVLSSAAFLAAVWFTYQLSRETRRGTYWVAFVVAAAGLGVHEWLKVVDMVFLVDQATAGVVREFGVVIGAVALAYGSYGIRSSVQELKQRAGDPDHG